MVGKLHPTSLVLSSTIHNRSLELKKIPIDLSTLLTTIHKFSNAPLQNVECQYSAFSMDQLLVVERMVQVVTGKLNLLCRLSTFMWSSVSGLSHSPYHVLNPTDL